MKLVRNATAFSLLMLATLPSANAQSVTGQMSGVVTDQGGSVIAGATARLTHDLSKQARTSTSDTNGNFLFTNLLPGNYSLHIEHAGFKGYDQKAIAVGAQERVALHELKLSVGDACFLPLTTASSPVEP